MADFATARLSRDQLILFPERLDWAIAPDHAVRLLDDILGRIDWTTWEQTYDLTRGQPPIHPRVLAGAILYGLLKRIRTSRALQEAIEVRNDFRWLVEDRRIDHTTICKFRQKNSANLKNLFVRIALLARELGYLPLASLGFDGTRLRANNRKTGTRTPEELRKAKEELAAKYTELEAQAAAADAQDNQRLGKDSEHKLGKELADVALRQKRVDAAIAELERLEQSGQKKPARIPITDPQSRITPNKEGGFAPNYTPTATVDNDSGIIVDAGVLAHTDEDKHMLASVANVQASMGLEQPPAELLADGMMSTGENLAACKEQGIDFYSPIKGTVGADNPAIREDPSVPVPAKDIERLPTTTTKKKDGTTSTTFNKSAFVYDAQSDVYWCPAGKPLPYTNQTSQTENGRQRVRSRYHAWESDCAGCPLASMCLSGNAKRRQVGHEQHEALRIEHAKKMSSDDGIKKYSRRRHAGERPFAVIKQDFGARRFLTRGLDRVADEWLWLCSAFNLKQLMSLISSGSDPPNRLSPSS